MEIRGFAAGPFQTNCYVLIDERSCVVIDPGLGAFAPVEAYLAERGLDLAAIVLTHGHIDHIRDAGALAHRFDAPVYIHPADVFMLESGAGVLPEMLQLFDVASMEKVKEEDIRPLDDAARVTLAGVDFHVTHAPGHSPGCVMLVSSDVVFSGDVLFRGAIGRTDLPYSDPEAMKRSLAGPVARLDDSLAVLPGHGAQTTVAHERGANPYLIGQAR